MIFCGGRALDENLTRACWRGLTAAPEGYGMTETSPVTHSSPSDPAQVKFGSVGFCATNTECKILIWKPGFRLGRIKRARFVARTTSHKGISIVLMRPPRPSTRKVAAYRRHRLRQRGQSLFHRGPGQGANQYKGFQVPPANLRRPVDPHRPLRCAVVPAQMTKPESAEGLRGIER